MSDKNASVFSVGGHPVGRKPLAEQPSGVIFEYFFDLPRQYRDIKPAFLNDMYFASALYAMSGAYEMETELFSRCGDGEVLQTRPSLLKRLNDRLSGEQHGIV